jgi:hypothetical protein
MKNKIVFLLMIFSGQALACPTCISDPETSKTYLIVIWTFIALIYIPFFLIFRSIIKNRNINKQLPSDDQAPQ